MLTNNKFSIAGTNIGIDFPPYLIAEMSANHNGKIENALRLIDVAKKAGADAVKIQTYTPDTITLKCDREDFKIKGGLWDGRTLYDLYEEAHTPWEWHKLLFEYARKIGITLFSSPFDSTAIDLLEDLNAPAYKIASFEAIDLPLIRYAASTKKPLIISTGMANSTEISEAINAAYDAGCENLAILHCVSGYPAPRNDYNLKTIIDMIKRFGLVTGLSDHTLDNIAAISSIALGASIIEKHFTLDRNGGGPDDSFSLEPHELALLVSDIKNAWQSLGKVDYSLKSSELVSIQHRRSLYFVQSLPSGSIVTNESIRSIRPGFGIAPKFYSSILGKTLNRDVNYGEPVTWECFEQKLGVH